MASPTSLPTALSSRIVTFCSYLGTDIDDNLMEGCAQLFSTNYGIWGRQPQSTSNFKKGTRVKMSGRMLRQQLLPTPDKTVLVACFKVTPGDTSNLELIGHAFATVWDSDLGKVGWVTQLVVDARERRRYIATQLLQTLKCHPLFHDITAIGLASTHAAACNALSKYIHCRIEDIDLAFIRDNAKSILAASPIPYIRNKELRGSLFNGNCKSGAHCSLFTNFYIDHTEPLQVLGTYKARRDWPLGDLLEGHEFLVICSITQ